MVDAFDVCIDRLHAGDSIDECLRRYPQYREVLRPLLQSAEAVRLARPTPAETAQAHLNARFRFEAALRDAPRRRVVPALARFAAAAAALVLVTGAALLVAAQPALPGDALYNLKRAGEQALISLAGGGEPEQLNQRRTDEISALLALGRTAEVNFEGTIEAMFEEQWQVGPLLVTVPPGTPGASDASAGDRVRIDGYTTPARELLATRVTVLERSFTPTPGPTAQVVSTSENTPTATPTVTATHTPTPTATPSATSTPTRTPTLTASPPAALPASCAPAAPTGWVTYAVRPGDTLSGLAAATGATVEQIRTVNCLGASSLLIVGQSLLLPSLPAARATAAPASPAPVATDDHGDDDSGGDDSGHDSDDDSDDHSGSGNRGSGGDD
jgi:LysM repeat protein